MQKFSVKHFMFCLKTQVAALLNDNLTELVVTVEKENSPIQGIHTCKKEDGCLIMIPEFALVPVN